MEQNPVSAPAALSAEAVSKRYGRHVQALSGVTLSVEWGRVTALVGPNAAGKSTLIKTWVGFERPTSGRVHVGGIDPWKDRAGALNLLAYLPQSAALFPELSVDEHLDLAVHLRRSFGKQEAAQRLRESGIPLRALVRDLSGGQRAQVGLALALCSHARILLLDEPLASLDPLARREFLDVLKQAVASTGVAAFLSSHVVSDVEYAADWLIVLGVGRKLLDTGLTDAISGHVIVGAESSRTPEVVARLPGGLGWLARIQGDVPDGRQPTLEEVVMGYLAAGRPEEAR